MSIQYERPPSHRPLVACLSIVLVLVLLLPIAGLVAWRFWPTKESGLNPQLELRPVAARGDLAALEKMNIEIYEHVSPSLVQVTNLAERNSLFGLDVQQVPKGVGSGFVWDQEGHIVTNFHVVEDADAALVTLSDHSKHEAQRAWVYPDMDIAVLTIQAPKSKLRPITIGTSHDLKVGQITYALGDPFGLDQTMTTGIISALGRQIQSVNQRTIRGVIQTSAPINPGNSGGPLLDSAGRLIGMNTAILSPSGAFAGIGFAIPVDEINQVVTELIRHGKIVRPALGVQLAQDQQARQLGVDHGAVILKVMPGGAAAEAGLEGMRADRRGVHVGDVIVALDGKPIENNRDLTTALDHHQVGDTVTLTIERNGERQDVQVTLKERK
ncbi:MAG TPA: trypsin-like peptidase domain-containing protein [Gemmataceae bacterium]|nr:trypsin-like peptidase domain-containing protein [Gemmataceae bacterium]